MRKGFTKIICTTLAAVSALSIAVLPACGGWNGVGGEKDSALNAVAGTNGGFVVETDGYVYFINGKESNTTEYNFGSALKGSVQRIKKSELEAGNYVASSETVVPSIVYSGKYDAGIYIYDGYIYYTAPSTEKNVDGETLNSNLDFRRSKLDGTGSSVYIWQSSDNAVDYRFVKGADEKVYIIYAATSEELYGKTGTNIHSVNCETGENTVLAYNVSGYAFDSADPENPTIYYTMSVPHFIDSSTNMEYNQLFKVDASQTECPRELDFSNVEGYDKDTNPIYVNLGDFVFDGIGKTNYESGRISQLNYCYGSTNNYEVNHDDYTYEIKSLEDGVLYYTRKSRSSSSLVSLYTLDESSLTSDWDAISSNDTQKPYVYGSDTSDYKFVMMPDKDDGNAQKTYAIKSGSDGITKTPLGDDGVIKDENAIRVSSATSATILFMRTEGDHVNLYYSLSDAVYRVALDGSNDDYVKYPIEAEPDASLVYTPVKILDINIVSDWYKPEFVGNTLFFATKSTGFENYAYIMACDLSADGGSLMTNKQLKEFNEQYEAVTEKIEEYDEVKNADESLTYENLSNALKYVFYTRDSEYLGELIDAYIEIEGKNEKYNEESAQIYLDFANAEGDWAEYKDADSFSSKQINGETVYANTRDYYYTVVGQMTEADKEEVIKAYKNDFMQSYPEDTRTWWEKLSTGEQIGFIVGMVVLGLVVIGGITVLTLWIIRRVKGKKAVEDKPRLKVDITDDKSVDVYGDSDEGNDSNRAE